MVVGAGEARAAIVKTLNSIPNIKRVVVAVDDNPRKLKQTIAG